MFIRRLDGVSIGGMLVVVHVMMDFGGDTPHEGIGVVLTFPVWRVYYIGVVLVM